MARRGLGAWPVVVQGVLAVALAWLCLTGCEPEPPKQAPAGPSLEIVKVDASDPENTQVTFRTSSGLDRFECEVPVYYPPGPKWVPELRARPGEEQVQKKTVVLEKVPPGDFKVTIDQRAFIECQGGPAFDTALAAKGTLGGVTVERQLDVTTRIQMAAQSAWDWVFLPLEGVGFLASHEKALSVGYKQLTYSAPSSGKAVAVIGVVLHSKLGPVTDAVDGRVSVAYRAAFLQGGTWRAGDMVELKTPSDEEKAAFRRVYGIEFQRGDSINWFLGQPVWLEASRFSVKAEAMGMAAAVPGGGAAGMGLSSLEAEVTP